MKKLWKYLGAAAAMTTLVPLRVDRDKQTKENRVQSLLLTISTCPNPDGGTKITIDFGPKNPFKAAEVPVEVVPMERDTPAQNAPAAQEVPESPDAPEPPPESPSFTEEEASWYADLGEPEPLPEEYKNIEEEPEPV